jgi:hypothetical protein
MRPLISIMRLAIVPAAAAIVAVSTASATHARHSDVWQKLHRPLHIPRLAVGSACPTAAPRPAPRPYVGTTFGPGPAFPGGINENGRPVLRYLDPIPPSSGWYGSGWFGNKVLWYATRYRGPVLIRGRQLDGDNELRFSLGFEMSASRLELHLRAKTPTTGLPSSTRVRAPGCYGYQIDGRRFSYVIVFEAKPDRP